MYIKEYTSSYILVKFINTHFDVCCTLDIQERNRITSQISTLIGILSEEEKQQIIRYAAGIDNIPISAFQAALSSLEIITKYLKEESKKSFKEIARILNRRLSTIYTTYKNSRIKFPGQLNTANSSILIPVEIFQDREYSILESLVAYLKEKEHLSLKEISSHLNKNYNTSKTVYRRFRLKNNNIEVQSGR